MKKAMNRRAFGKAVVAVAGGAVAGRVGVGANPAADDGERLPQRDFPTGFTVEGGVVYVVDGDTDEVWRIVDKDGGCEPI